MVRYLADFGVPAENFAVDLTIARGLDYYTGTVYETTLLDHPEIGSVCSGGRYDNLAEYYTDRQLPGAGISIGLTRLFYVLGEQGMLNPDLPTAPADVLILPMTEDLSPAISLATLLRENGIRTQLHCEEKKFKQKIAYADKLGIPYVIFLGEDEIAGGVVACKDMATGEQTKLEPAATVYRIKAGLAEREPLFRWSIQHSNYAYGTSDVYEYLQKARAFTIEPVAERITQDVLLLSAREDLLVDFALYKQEIDLLKNTRSLEFAAPGRALNGQAHCNRVNTKYMLDLILNWNDRMLER